MAQTWLQLDAQNRSQAVDIDLDALKVARRRLLASQREGRAVSIIQSAEYSSTGQLRTLEYDVDEARGADGSQEIDDGQGIEVRQSSTGAEQSTVHHTTDRSQGQNHASEQSTWAQGAASERFERRFQARLAKEKKGTSTKTEEGAGTLTLLHADVLRLPLQGADIEAPDLVYAGNYALSYFHDRTSLLAYLSQCRRTLRKGTGVLIVDPFAGPTSWEPKDAMEREEQEHLWTTFANEPGFLRAGEQGPPAPAAGHPLEFWKPAHDSSADSANWRHWPRGRLVLVRKGHVGGGYEYWREDGPLDYATNRFRMSLSFRFADHSWLRDYFSYDFRVWSLCEIKEAMHEVGFEDVAIHAIPRTTHAEEASRSRSSSLSMSDRGTADGSSSDELGLQDMANLLKQTEKHEAEKSTYQALEPGQKLFATKSFGSECTLEWPVDLLTFVV